MGRNFLIVAAAICLAWASMAVAAASKCKLVRIEEWPVRQERGHLIVDGAINGQKIGIILDTGATSSLILRSAAVRLGLERRWLKGYRAFGVGGETDLETAYVEEFKIGQAVRKGWRVVVAGEQDFGGDAAFLLGEDFFRQADVEFDLAHNAVRLFQPKDCEGHSLAYWANDVVGEVEIDKIDGRRPWIGLTVRINGQPVKAVFDSGAGASLLDKRVAERLGVTPETPGVVGGGRTVGIGKKPVDVWIGRFQSFAIGNETIKDTTIKFADFLAQVPGDVPLEDRGPPMILGNDFLRAHRVLVAHSQRKFYFTHVGGPVFNAGLPQWTPDAAQCAKGGQPTDARIAACTRAITSGELSSENLGITYNNRGNGWVNNGEYDKAIADYDEAIRLNAQRALTYGNRGNAWYRKGDNDRAIADYGEAIRLNPLGAPHYFRRGLTQFWLGRFDASVSDLTESLRLNPSQSYAIIWRYLAQSRSGKPEIAKSEFSAKLGPLDKTKWPAPIIDFLLGKSDPDALLKAAEHPDAESRRGQVCEAEFYVGEWHLLNLRLKEASDLLSRAEKTCPKTFIEYEAAVAELRRMTK